jgi:glycosyltransferase involved in cell wall biosynthesis
VISAIYIISGFIIIAYGLLIVKLYLGLGKLKKASNILQTDKEQPSVSLLISFRNEEEHIQQLLEDIQKQSIVLHEIILINDHSEDDSARIVEQFIQNKQNWVLINLPPQITGKKAALSYGTKLAKGEVFLFTDADCRLQALWAQIMLSAMQKTNVSLVAGPVDMLPKNGILQALQNLEFLSLTGSTAGGFGSGIPFICNGANLAVKREVYIETFNTQGNRFTSGDDVFLLHSVKKKYNVGYCYNAETIVYTLPQANISSFINQRIRWASKAKGYKDTTSFLISFLMLLVQLLIFTLLIAGIWNLKLWIVMAVVVFLKLGVDSIFMRRVLHFYQKTYLLKLTPILQIFYLFYILIVGIAGLFYKAKWKGRRIS